MACSVKIVGDEFVLRIPLNTKPEKSSSGKTLVVAAVDRRHAEKLDVGYLEQTLQPIRDLAEDMAALSRLREVLAVLPSNGDEFQD